MRRHPIQILDIGVGVLVQEKPGNLRILVGVRVFSKVQVQGRLPSLVDGIDIHLAGKDVLDGVNVGAKHRGHQASGGELVFQAQGRGAPPLHEHAMYLIIPLLHGQPSGIPVA